jgi:hypothetical protein
MLQFLYENQLGHYQRLKERDWIQTRQILVENPADRNKSTFKVEDNPLNSLDYIEEWKQNWRQNYQQLILESGNFYKTVDILQMITVSCFFAFATSFPSILR